MAKYVSAEKFANRYKNLEKVARNHLANADPTSVEYQIYLTQIKERADVQKDLEFFHGINIDFEGEI